MARSRRGRGRYRRTSRQRYASRQNIKKAQLASARKRKSNAKRNVAIGVGVIAAGSLAVVLGSKVKNRGGNPQQVASKVNAPPRARRSNMNVARNAVNRRVIVTGSRYHTGREQIFNALEQEFLKAKSMTVVHGGAAGADSIASLWARQKKSYGFDVTEEVHPAEWRVHGRAAGPIRNRKMAELGGDIVLAFPLGKSSGTRGMMKISRQLGLKVKEL